MDKSIHLRLSLHPANSTLLRHCFNKILFVQYYSTFSHYERSPYCHTTLDIIYMMYGSWGVDSKVYFNQASYSRVSMLLAGLLNDHNSNSFLSIILISSIILLINWYLLLNLVCSITCSLLFLISSPLCSSSLLYSSFLVKVLSSFSFSSLLPLIFFDLPLYFYISYFVYISHSILFPPISSLPYFQTFYAY